MPAPQLQAIETNQVVAPWGGDTKGFTTWSKKKEDEERYYNLAHFHATSTIIAIFPIPVLVCEQKDLLCTQLAIS